MSIAKVSWPKQISSSYLRNTTVFLTTQGCHRDDENSHLSEDAWTRSPCYDPILVMKAQVSVKPTSELLIADKMVAAVRERLYLLKCCCQGKSCKGDWGG